MSQGKAFQSSLMEDTWAGEVGNVEKPAGAQRVREASKNIHQPREKKKKKEEGIDILVLIER